MNFDHDSESAAIVIPDRCLDCDLEHSNPIGFGRRRAVALLTSLFACFCLSALFRLHMHGMRFNDNSLMKKHEQDSLLDSSLGKPFTLAGKSIYFLVIDRFARSGLQAQNFTPCCLSADWINNTGGGYCGGTLQGIIDHLDYIKGMNFDCIWITPPVESNSFMGYDAKNIFEINRHFGSKTALKQLSAAIHSRGMCLVVDIVLNHMQPLNVDGAVVTDTLYPFSAEEHYNQRDRKADQSFSDYAVKHPGAFTTGYEDGQRMKALYAAGKVKCGPTVTDQTECGCMPGNGAPSCPNYDPVMQVDGWIGALGDLNQSVPFVREKLINYVQGLVKDYQVDAFRLDTAIYMPKSFLRDVQREADVEIIGETTVNNLTYHASFQRDEDGRHVLSALLNFPPFYHAASSFCAYQLGGRFSDYSKQGSWEDHANLSNLGSVMKLQLESGSYDNLDLLGNFADNHDEYGRMAWYCKHDLTRIKNVLS